MANYSEYWDKPDKEVWQGVCDSLNVNQVKPHALKLLLEMRNADRLSRATRGLRWATYDRFLETAPGNFLSSLELGRDRKPLHLPLGD